MTTTKEISQYIAACDSFETPLYLYNFDIIQDKVNEFKSFFCQQEIKILYAMKANSNLSILKLIDSMGVGFDACSTEELFLLSEIGVDMSGVYYNSDCVSLDELSFASKTSANIIIGSLDTLELYCSKKIGKSVGLRVNTGHGAGHSPLVTTGGAQSKFGIHINELPRAVQLCSDHDISIVGLHTHAGSGIKNWRDYIENASRLIDCAKIITHLEYLNFGGGFDVKYDAREEGLDLFELSKELCILIKEIKHTHEQINIFVEPGRYLVANSGVLLTTVVTVKQNEGVKYVGVDTGFNHFARCFLYDAFHDMINITSNSDVAACYDIVGYLCQSGDVFARGRILYETVQGDIICIKDVGAYGFSMSSSFNSRRKIAEAAIINGELKLIRRREDFKSLLLNQQY